MHSMLNRYIALASNPIARTMTGRREIQAPKANPSY